MREAAEPTFQYNQLELTSREGLFDSGHRQNAAALLFTEGEDDHARAETRNLAAVGVVQFTEEKKGGEGAKARHA